MLCDVQFVGRCDVAAARPASGPFRRFFTGRAVLFSRSGDNPRAEGPWLHVRGGYWSCFGKVPLRILSERRAKTVLPDDSCDVCQKSIRSFENPAENYRLSIYQSFLERELKLFLKFHKILLCRLFNSVWQQKLSQLSKCLSIRMITKFTIEKIFRKCLEYIESF